MRNYFGLELTKQVKIGISIGLILTSFIIIYFVIFYNKQTSADNTKKLKTGTYTIQSSNNSSYVNVNNGALNTSSTQNGDNTKWNITLVDAVNNLYSICNVGLTTNGCLGLSGNNGVTLTTYVPYIPKSDTTPASGNNAQSWAVNPLADGNYEIISSWGTYLNPQSAMPANTTAATTDGQGPYLNLYSNGLLGLWMNGSSAQQWIIKPI